MIVRKLDSLGDWTFGKSRSDYLSGNLAVAQSIKTRVSSFLNDCFFDLGAGIDWFTFLGGSKDQVAVQLAVGSVIINTQNVTGILLLSSVLNDVTRGFTVTYRVQTTYSQASGTFSYDLNGSI